MARWQNSTGTSGRARRVPSHHGQAAMGKWESVRGGGSDEGKLDVVFFIAVPTVWVDVAAKVEKPAADPHHRQSVTDRTSKTSLAAEGEIRQNLLP